MLDNIKEHLARIAAHDVVVTRNDEFEPDAGPLVKVELEGAYWHLAPTAFEQLLEAIPDGAGSEAVREAIEKKAPFVWHGPSPKGSRDTSP